MYQGTVFNVSIPTDIGEVEPIFCYSEKTFFRDASVSTMTFTDLIIVQSLESSLTCIASRFITLPHAASRCLALFHGTSRCLMFFQSVSRCLTVSHVGSQSACSTGSLESPFR